MALDSVSLAMVAPLLRGARVLCLGYPDILPPEKEVSAVLKISPSKFTQHGDDYKLKHRLVETIHAFELAGVELIDFVDIQPSRQVELRVDLNYEHSWLREYDLVIDPGTLEHCFDLKTAMFNAWSAVKVGGVILHCNPMTMLNHGFVNLCPTLFYDFAAANGGEVIRMLSAERGGKRVTLEMHKRFSAPSNSALYTLIRKTQQVDLTVPTQRRYQALCWLPFLDFIDQDLVCCVAALLG
jgi:hypothetical protein